MNVQFFAREAGAKQEDFDKLLAHYTGSTRTGRDVETEPVSKFPADLPDFGLVLRDRAGVIDPTRFIQAANQAEDLLDQIVQCVDRCLGDKALYDGLRMERLKLALDLYEAGELLKISKSERDNDAFWKSDEHQANLEAEARECLIRSYPPVGSPITSDSLSGLLTESMKYAMAQTGSNWFQKGPGERSWHHSSYQDAAAASQAKSSEEANAALGKAAKTRAQKATIARASEEQRIDLRRDLLAYRAAETRREGSILHYDERTEEIARRATRDFKEAIDKAYALYSGLVEVFKLPCEAVDVKQWKRPLDELILWVRTAKDLLNAVKLREQRLIVRLDLSSLVDRKQLASGKSCDFTVHGDSIGASARLIGLSGIVHSPSPKFCTLVVTIPEQSMGKSGKLAAVPIHMGRVAIPELGAIPDIYGMPLARNRSCQGKWSVQMFRPIGSADDQPEIALDLVVLQ